MVRAHSLSWEEKRAINDRPFFICPNQIRLGWQPSAVSQNKQASKHND
jgi:hypothetical protein